MLVGTLIGLVIDGRIWMLRGESPVGRESLQFPTATILLTFVGAFLGLFLFTQVLSTMIRPYLRRYLEREKDA